MVPAPSKASHAGIDSGLTVTPHTGLRGERAHALEPARSHRQRKRVALSGTIRGCSSWAASRALPRKRNPGHVSGGDAGDEVRGNGEPVAAARSPFGVVLRERRTGFRLGAAPTPEPILDPQTVIQRQFDAYNAHDLEAFLALFANEVRLYRPPDGEPAIVGKRALGGFYAEQRFNQPDLRAELIHRAVIGDKVIDHERIHGLTAEPFEMVMVFQVSAGLIRNCWAFTAA